MNNFDKIMFPMIRRAFPQLITNQLVGVQPMMRNTGPLLTKWKKVFLWKPARVSGKYRWLIHANEKFQRHTNSIAWTFSTSKDIISNWKSCGYYNDQDMFLESL